MGNGKGAESQALAVTLGGNPISKDLLVLGGYFLLCMFAVQVHTCVVQVCVCVCAGAHSPALPELDLPPPGSRKSFLWG